MKAKRVAILPIIATSILASCGPTYAYCPEEFTTWTSEDGNLILYSQYGGQGGNGKLYKYDRYEDICWVVYAEGGKGIYIYELSNGFGTSFAYSDLITESNADNYKDTFSLTFTLPSGSEFKDSHRKYMKKYYTMHKDVLDESRIDARYFLGYNIVNKSLGISFSNTIAGITDPKGALNISKENYPGLRFSWKDNRKFEFVFNDKVSNGTYYTSKSNVFLKFDVDEIFNLAEGSFFFEMEEINYDY